MTAVINQESRIKNQVFKKLHNKFQIKSVTLSLVMAVRQRRARMCFKPLTTPTLKPLLRGLLWFRIKSCDILRMEQQLLLSLNANYNWQQLAAPRFKSEL